MLAHQVGRLACWRRALAAFSAGAASVLSLAPFHLWPVLALTLPVLVWLIDGQKRTRAGSRLSGMRAAAGDGWWFGFGYFLAGVFWIGEAFLVEAHIFGWMMPFAVGLMAAGLALFLALAAAAARLYWPEGLARLLVLAVALAVSEYLRGHVFTGFPWNVIGYALTAPLVMMQSAGLVGIYGLTLIAVSALAAPLVAIADARRIDRGVGAAVAAYTLVPLALLAGYGVARLVAPDPQPVAGVRLRLVQPSIPQAEKWSADSQAWIFNEHLMLSRQDAQGRVDDLDGITHVIWPEAAMPFLPLATPQALEAIGRLLPQGTYLVSGALRIENSEIGDRVEPSKAPVRRVFNSMLVFGTGGGLVTLYDKIHLVPFGEYLPFQETLEAIGLESLTRLRGGFAVGERPRRLLAVPGLPPASPLICYEAIFPAAIVQGAERPGLLINVTNDGWFGETTGPYQHLHQARVRAVEEGVPMVRSANNGVSAVIDGKGRIVAEIGLNVRGAVDAPLPPALEPPLYARFGDNTFAAILTVYLFALATFIWIDRRSVTR
ncbi:MAG: apolipoprotein N-acyltransferase [Hyphomicrobiaceae bacterium]|nr:apolipoprotein N-acyltransferase [Hyphomicrobiaceae bacterium]